MKAKKQSIYIYIAILIVMAAGIGFMIHMAFQMNVLRDAYVMANSVLGIAVLVLGIALMANIAFGGNQDARLARIFTLMTVTDFLSIFCDVFTYEAYGLAEFSRSARVMYILSYIIGSIYYVFLLKYIFVLDNRKGRSKGWLGVAGIILLYCLLMIADIFLGILCKAEAGIVYFSDLGNTVGYVFWPIQYILFFICIHGGAFVVEAAGDYLYHGHNFGVAHKDEVVLVTIEYRLGVLGFVHFEEMFGDEYKNSANLGLYDQIEALKWIQKNISAFGGDPENVTIFGESAGAGSTSLLSISPLAQGLFKRSIAQSGASGFAGRKGPGLKVAREWVEKKGCKTIEELLALPAEELYDCPQVGPSYPSEVLPYNNYEEMYEAWRTGLGKDIDHMSGTNENEMAYFILTAKDPYLFLMSELAIQDKRRGHIGEKDLWRFDKLMELTDGKDALTPLLRMTNDLVFHVQQYSQVISHGETEGKGKNYMYFCTTESHHNRLDYKGFNLGACHAVEVSYVLNNLHWPEVSGPNQSQEFADTLQRMWINFAKTGDPSTPELAWPEFNRENWNVMVLDDGRKGGCRVDNTAMKAEMELALPLRVYNTMEEGL